MDKRSRLEAAISGAAPDRIPVALWRHWPGDDQRPADLAAAQVKWQQDYDWDFVKVSPSSSFSIRDYGAEDRWVGHIEGTREYTRRVIHDPSDWMRLPHLDPGQGALGGQLACLDLLRPAFGSHTPFIQTVFSPLAQARNLAGQDLLLAHLRSHPAELLAGLRILTENTIRFVEAAMSRGIAGIYYAVQLANEQHLSEAEYALFGKSFDLQVLAAAQSGWLNLLHLHDGGPLFRLAADYPVQLLNWHDRESWPDLATGLSIFSGAACGGVNRDVLHLDDPAAFLEQARHAHAQTGGRRWVLGVGCVSLVTTPTGNIRRFRALVESLSSQ